MNISARILTRNTRGTKKRLNEDNLMKGVAKLKKPPRDHEARPGLLDQAIGVAIETRYHLWLWEVGHLTEAASQ